MAIAKEDGGNILNTQNSTSRANAAATSRLTGQASAYGAATPSAALGYNNPYAGMAPTDSGTSGASGGGAPQDFSAWNSDNDGLFQTQKTALENARNAAIAKLTTDFNRYDVDYGNSLRHLGFDGDIHALDTAKYDGSQGNFGQWMNEQGSPVDGIGWNETDQTTASGRGLNNLLNDYASRGMAQSSAYAQARNDLFRSLNDQLASTASARNNYQSDITNQVAGQNQSLVDAINQARQEATLRSSGQLSGQ